MFRREVEHECMDWIELTQTAVFYEYGHEPSDSIRSGILWTAEYKLLKADITLSYSMEL
jgi:hypothetical protein